MLSCASCGIDVYDYRLGLYISQNPTGEMAEWLRRLSGTIYNVQRTAMRDPQGEGQEARSNALPCTGQRPVGRDTSEMCRNLNNGEMAERLKALPC